MIFPYSFGFKLTLAMATFGLFQNANAQCADEANVTSYTYNGTTYEVIQENQTWADAAACAVERGGHLIEVNDSSEQASIFSNLPFINFMNTAAPDGGGGGYLWIGGNDSATEGEWMWDGDNDGNGTSFWLGDVNGSPVGGAYTNWGNEPDDFGTGQDGLGYAITNWPMGLQEQWNDVDVSNSLYYIVEYPTLSVDPINADEQEKTLVKIIDAMGRETVDQPNMLLIFMYSDGSSEKVYRVE